MGWFHIVAPVAGFFCAGYALYAWFKLRDKPTAIQVAGSALIIFSTTAAEWLDVVMMFVGLGVSFYGTRLALRRNYRRMTDESLARFAPSRGPDQRP